MNTSGITSAPGFKYNAGIAYVGIPSDLDRNEYIADCYRNHHISVHLDDGGFSNRVPISPEVLGFITFPAETNELGSPLVYIMDEIYQQPYIVARLMRRDELGDSNEHAFKFSRKLNGSFVEVSGSAKDNMINILVDGDEDAGLINLKLYSKNEDCKLLIDVQGDVEISSSKSTYLSQQKEMVVETIDSESDDFSKTVLTPTDYKIYTSKMQMNEGEENMVLGAKLKTFLGKFIDQVAAIKTTTAIGLQPIINATEVLALKNELDSFLSKEGFLKQ